jgi:peptidoglycan/xylan/chitin deacetylase (PgdA/CDA1 family)
MTAMYSMPVCKILNIKLVNGLIINSPERQNLLNKDWRRAKITFPFSDVVVGNSRAGLAAYRSPEHKSFVIYNGFNFERTGNLTNQNIIREELKIKTKYIIGMVASYSKNKDYYTFYIAAHLILQKRKDVTFLAIGKGTDSPASWGNIKDEYIDYFRLLGNKNCVESYISILDIGVLSTFTEGISNSILEYMAFGKPVIATNGGGTNEIVVDQETGFLIGRSNPAELAEKMDTLLNDNGLRIKMGLAGKERIRNSFSIDTMVTSYISLYKDIHSSVKVNEANFVKKFLKEALGFFLVQAYYVRHPKDKGILSLYFHNPPELLFENILKWLIKKKYSFISVQELNNLINEKTDSENKVFICFDDGWNGNLELIKLIEKYRVPVAIFITVEALKLGNFWWEYALLNDQKRYTGIKKIEDFKNLPENSFKEKVALLKRNFSLRKRSSLNLNELKEISKCEYITIGSHSVTHPILTNCSPETQKRELMESKIQLGQMLNNEIEYLAYPNGSYNNTTIEIAKECGYKLCFTINPGRIDVETVDPYTIPRNALYDGGGYYENISKILGTWQKVIPFKDY